MNTIIADTITSRIPAVTQGVDKAVAVVSPKVAAAAPVMGPILQAAAKYTGTAAAIIVVVDGITYLVERNQRGEVVKVERTTLQKVGRGADKTINYVTGVTIQASGAYPFVKVAVPVILWSVTAVVVVGAVEIPIRVFSKQGKERRREFKGGIKNWYERTSRKMEAMGEVDDAEALNMGIEAMDDLTRELYGERLEKLIAKDPEDISFGDVVSVLSPVHIPVTVFTAKWLGKLMDLSMLPTTVAWNFGDKVKKGERPVRRGFIKKRKPQPIEEILEELADKARANGFAVALAPREDLGVGESPLIEMSPRLYDLLSEQGWFDAKDTDTASVDDDTPPELHFGTGGPTPANSDLT